MRDAMARAEVGDDVFGEDPTVLALQAEVARITGKEAALFVPSGTMSNQLAIATQTRPGDDVILGLGSHPGLFEAGACAALNGVQLTVLGQDGFFSSEEMAAALHPRTYWAPGNSLVVVENTHNRAGRVWPQAQARAVADRAHALGLACHLDGARLWSASVATGLDMAALSAPFDTVSVCFSKGLGAPVGSALCGTGRLIENARRLRRRWGGAMRQAGILAAGALYALSHHRARLAEDHAHARLLAEKLARVPGIAVNLARVETNIVYLEFDQPAAIVSRLAREAGVLINVAGAHALRAVTHLDVSRDDLERAADILAHAAEQAARVIQRGEAGGSQ